MLGPYYESVYRPLNHEKKEVRFLKILRTPPSDGSGASIECTLCTESLETDVEFEAISYVWGDPEDTKVIILNESPFTVTRNAFDILDLLCTKYPNVGYLWIDAVCINQDNTPEKNQQIQLMRTIYQQARTVHIGLASTVENENLLGSTLTRMKAEESLDSIFATVASYEIFKIVCSCAWWSRLWVVQEALLSSHDLFHIGRITMNWDDMKTLCRHLVRRFLDGNINEIRLDELSAATEAISKVLNLFGCHDAHMDRRFTIRLLDYMNNKSVSDEKDRVYGALGLLPSDLDIKPNYHLSVAVIYKDFALRLMKHSQSLEMLTFCGHRNADPTWPSWVLQLQNQFIAVASSALSASRGATFFIDERTRSSIAVRAHVVERIFRVGESFKLYGLRLEGNAEELECIRQQLEAWRRLISSPSDSNVQRKLRYSQFWRTILAGVHQRGSISRRPRMNWTRLNELNPWLEDGSFELDLEKEQIVRSLRCLSSRRFFVLEGGLMGLTETSPTSGDYVMILAGCSLPLILRSSQRSGNEFTIVGSCHISDLEGGQYIYRATSDAVPWISSQRSQVDEGDFASEIATMYEAGDATDLWLRDVDLAKSTLRNLTLANADRLRASDVTAGDVDEPSVEGITESEESFPLWALQVFDVILDRWRISPVGSVPTATLLERIIFHLRLSDLIHHAFSLAVLLLHIVDEIRTTLPCSLVHEHSLFQAGVRDLGLRLGLYTFEALVQVETAKGNHKLSREEKLALVAIYGGFWSGENSELEKGRSVASTKWLVSLQRLAQHHARVEEHIDTIFEEIVLV